MSKNVIHNFNILIQDSADVKSAEDLTNVMIKELAKVSKEMSQQKDIEQIWQEQKDLNAVINNSVTPIEEGVANAEESRKQKVLDGTTSSISEGIITNSTISNVDGVNVMRESIGTSTLSSNVPIGEGVADTFDRTKMNSVSSANTTSPVSETESEALNWSSGTTTQTYTGVERQETLTVPQTSSNEPSIEVVKAAIKEKLNQANTANDRAAVEYWTNISKAFDERPSVQDFDGKPNHALFTEMYAALKQSNSVTATQNFNWETVREKMIKAIDTNILLGEISEGSKKRWKTIRDQLKNDTINVANLFEQYNELFLLLGQVEGLDDLPGTITITTKTKIYPNLSADRLYGKIGREAVYVFLKEISSIDARGNAVKRGAVKIKNTAASSFIVGESLEFFLDETLIVQNGYKNEGINWIVYKGRKGKKDEETIFEDEGTSFSYNFDTEATYKVEAYGHVYGANNKKSKKSFAFVEVKIVAQELVITPPSIVKGRLARPSAKEFIFKTALKYPKVKSLNPLKFYYQIEAKINNKGTTISDEKELDSTGNISLLMPDLGTYKIKIISKNQYALTQEFEVSAIKNEVTSIGPIKGESNKNVFLLGGSKKTFTLEAKTFKIPPTAEEKGDVKWIVYDSKNNPYLTSGDTWHTEKDTPKRKHLHRWESFEISIPNKEGHYTIEAFSDIAKGVDAKATFKMEVQRPQVTEAYWAYSNGDKKETSGFSGEVNHVKAKIPGYDNQKVRINFYLNGSKKPSYYNETTTNESGEINKIITFDDTFQRRFGVQEGKTAKISFKLMGIQNDRLYPFKRNADVNPTAVLNVATGAKITDLYFEYESSRVNLLTPVPYGAKVKGVVKTLNKVGQKVVLKIYKNIRDIKHTEEVKVNNEGVAIIDFTLNEEWYDINPLMSMMDMFYLGLEGLETELSLKNGLNAGISKSIQSIMDDDEVIDENDPQLVWGAKVSKEFRVKVVKMAKKLRIDPNWIMIIIAKETSLTFDPHIDNGIGYVGLIQFSEDSAKEVGTTHLELKKMTAETQLKYVEKRFEMFGKQGYETLTDLYLAVLNPSSVGKGNKDSNILWTSKRMAYYNNPSYHKQEGEYDNKIIKNGKIKRGFEEGTTYMWEVRQELERLKIEGQKFERMLKALPLELKYKNWALKEITSGYGKRDVDVGSKFHKGLDFNYSGGGDTDIGAPIKSTHNGFVYNLKDDATGNTGRYLVIRSENGLFQTRYLHLSKIHVKINEKIKKGQKIGELGASYNGKEKGGDIKAHLHYEIMTLESKSTKEVYSQIDPTDGHGKNKDYLVDPQDWIK